jgi:miniconductance mechanosensitive channel
VLVLSILIDRSPLWMLSGLGALSAVLLLVFKDTLLSLVASTQLTSNDMLRIGDWIEMPQSNADGFVKDIALHTVKVQNWDNTVTTVPTYKLFSESYRNYRQMFESGGRRIKRTLRIDATCVRFLTDEETLHLMHFRLLHDYLADKQIEVDEANRNLGELASEPANRRRLTNIGTFRAYGLAYLHGTSGDPQGHGDDGAHDGTGVARHSGRGVLLHGRHGVDAVRAHPGRCVRPLAVDPAGARLAAVSGAIGR